ncbi:MAG: acyl-CoA dehydrogenase family protein [Dehalococcoidia bacterium]|nr:acyl-CoA dehydrogenase family protein [Dehalococcoidia bacterium]
MDFRFTPEQEKRRAEFHAICKELASKRPASFIGEKSMFDEGEGWQYFKYCARELGKRGLIALSWPKEHGGSGDRTDQVMLAEAMGYNGCAGLDPFGVGMLAPTLLAVASEELKKEFLPGIAKGETMWCELWSEPNAGSDLAALTCNAIRKGDEFIINGQKTWNTNAHNADWGFGVFRSDPNAPKHKNLTFLLMDMKTPGITVKPLYYMNDGHILNEVFFDDVHVPAKYIVGKEGGGWAVVNVLAGFERSGVGGVASMQRHIEHLVEYCNHTLRRGKPLSQDPLVRNRLAQLATDVEAAKTLSYRIADQQGRNEMGLMDASGMKVFSTELEERMAAFALDLFGPFGQVKYSRWAHFAGLFENTYQESFVGTISAGTNEIQRNIIAWYGLGLPRMK